MTTFQAAVMTGPGQPLVVKDIPAPNLEPGAALLRTLYSEVCGTDVHLHHGKLDVPVPDHPRPRLRRHRRSVGRQAHDIEGNTIKEGDVVTFLDVHETCNNCYYCLVARQPTRCPSPQGLRHQLQRQRRSARRMGRGDLDEAGREDGQAAEGAEPETFIGGGCGLVTALHAVDMAELKLGESVAVLGVGPVGQSCVAFASLSGAGELIAIGAPHDRLEFARRMGATATLGLDVPPETGSKAFVGLTGGRGVDAVIEASGAPEAVKQALDLVRDGGRVIVCGQYTDNGPVEIHPHWQLNRKHVEVKGCWGSRYDHFHRAAALTARYGDRKPWRDMVSGRFTLDRANEALARSRTVRRSRLLLRRIPV